MELKRQQYKELIGILRGCDLDADKAMDVADEICDLFDKVEVVKTEPAQEQPSESKKLSAQEASKLVPDGRPVHAEKVKGDNPVMNTNGGFIDHKGEFVPTGRKVTSLMGAPDQ